MQGVRPGFARGYTHMRWYPSFCCHAGCLLRRTDELPQTVHILIRPVDLTIAPKANEQLTDSRQAVLDPPV